MIRNIALKKTLKNTIFPIFTCINKIIPKKDKNILLYSANGGIQHSLAPIRDYLIKNDINKKYKVYCGIESMQYAEEDGLIYINHIKAMLVFFRTKHVFYTTGQIPLKPSKNQIVIHMRHGNSNFKSCGLKTNINNGDEFYFTYMLASSPLFVPIMAKEYGCNESSIVAIGDPMIDKLLHSKKIKGFEEFNKVLLWLPTFRQSDYLGYDDSAIEDIVPLFPESSYELLNEELRKYNIKLIVKLHPAQSSKATGKLHYEYLDIYTNEEFIRNGFKLYDFMFSADGLVGDYSSASMQFLILNRPQAFVIPDIEEYAQRRGFVFENPLDYMAGHIIKKQEDFFAFLHDFATDMDAYKEKRNIVRDKIYTYKDDKNCERVLQLSQIQKDEEIQK